MAASTTDTTHPNHEFHLFSHLHDELQINILSYVADAPLEEKDSASESSPTIITTATTTAAAATTSTTTPNSLSNRSMMYSSTLTHVLPYVCKKFHTVYSKSDELWKDAILRQLLHQSEPDLWYNALHNIVHKTKNRTYHTSNKNSQSKECGSDNGNDGKYKNARQLIDSAYQIVAVSLQQQSSNIEKNMSYRYLYRIIMNTQLRQVLPVFIMNGDVVLNEPYGLHLFEYRYRYMMQNLMQEHVQMVRQANRNYGSHTSSSTQAQLLQQYPIYFIHANRGNVRRSEMAVIVQVVQCDLHPDGRADIIVKPIHFVWIERSWLHTSTSHHHNLDHPAESDGLRICHTSTGAMSQPPAHNLFFAQVLKMGRTATNAMHYLQRQETLTNVMERLIASGIMVHADDDEIHLPHSNIRPIHINLFDHGDDDDDNDDDEIEVEGEDQYI